MRYVFSLMLVCLASCVVQVDESHPVQNDATDDSSSDDWLPQGQQSTGPQGCAPFIDAEGRPIPTLCNPFYIDKGDPAPERLNPSEKVQVPVYDPSVVSR